MASGITMGRFIDVFGIEQWISIRGHDRRNPVLLIVSGPGVALSPMTPLFAEWEREFTIAQWDQPGAGATYAKNRATDSAPLTLDRLTRDGLSIAAFVRDAVGVPAVGVLGISGGTIVGLRMMLARPASFSVYVGTGQFVDWHRQEARSYAMVLARARANHDSAAVSALEQIGPPPYADAAADAIKGKYAGALTPAEQTAFAAVDPSVMAAIRTPPADATYVPAGLAAIDPRTASLAAYTQLRDEYQRFDARSLGTRFEMPIVFIQGELDAYSPTADVEEYASEIEAPSVAVAKIPGGGHSCVFMTAAFLEQLRHHVPRPSSG